MNNVLMNALAVRVAQSLFVAFILVFTSGFAYAQVRSMYDDECYLQGGEFCDSSRLSFWGIVLVVSVIILICVLIFFIKEGCAFVIDAARAAREDKLISSYISTNTLPISDNNVSARSLFAAKTQDAMTCLALAEYYKHCSVREGRLIKIQKTKPSEGQAAELGRLRGSRHLYNHWVNLAKIFGTLQVAELDSFFYYLRMVGGRQVDPYAFRTETHLFLLNQALFKSLADKKVDFGEVTAYGVPMLPKSKYFAFREVLIKDINVAFNAYCILVIDLIILGSGRDVWTDVAEKILRGVDMDYFNPLHSAFIDILPSR